MDDPLSKYRKAPGPGLGRGGEFTPPAAPVMTAQPASGPEPYAALVVNEKVLRLKIRPAMESWRALYYENLDDIVSDGPYGKSVTLIFRTLLVTMRGKNLQPVVAALESGNADCLQEFHPDLWPRPAAEEPIIEEMKIQCTVQQIAEMQRKMAAESQT